jgi:hypothetical protein
MAPTTVLGSTLVNNTFSGCDMMAIFWLHDPTCHSLTVKFWGARWYNCRMQEQRLHSASSFSPSQPCTYDSFPVSSHLVSSSSVVLFLGWEAIVRSYCSSSQTESGSACRHLIGPLSRTGVSPMTTRRIKFVTVESRCRDGLHGR